MKKILIRDGSGKIIPALLIRRLRIKGFEDANLGLVDAGSQITVSELSSGAQIGWRWKFYKDAEKESVSEAKAKLKKHGRASFDAGVKQMIARFNGEVLNQ